MESLQDVQKLIGSLDDVSISNDKIKEIYESIPNKEVRVNTTDKKYVACTDDSELDGVKRAITKLNDASKLDITNAVKTVCGYLKGVHSKPRITFYVLVLNELN